MNPLLLTGVVPPMHWRNALAWRNCFSHIARSGSETLGTFFAQDTLERNFVAVSWATGCRGPQLLARSSRRRTPFSRRSLAQLAGRRWLRSGRPFCPSFQNPENFLGGQTFRIFEFQISDDFGMHEQRDLVELRMTNYTTQKFFVDTNGPLQEVPPAFRNAAQTAAPLAASLA